MPWKVGAMSTAIQVIKGNSSPEPGQQTPWQNVASRAVRASSWSRDGRSRTSPRGTRQGGGQEQQGPPSPPSWPVVLAVCAPESTKKESALRRCCWRSPLPSDWGSLCSHDWLSLPLHTHLTWAGTFCALIFCLLCTYTAVFILSICCKCCSLFTC